MSWIKQVKSSAALVVAVIALIAALGGGAVAGVTISKLNKKEKAAVKRISKKQARRLDKRIELTPGPRGPQGPPGGFAGIYEVTTTNPSLAPEVSAVIQPDCDPGDLAVSGGWEVPADVSGDVVVKAFDRWDEDEWRVYFRNTSTTTAYAVTAHTYCIDQG